MAFGKTIKLYLIEGTPDGRMTCELSNWSGKSYKIPRIRVKDCTDRPELTNPGVYMLFGALQDEQDAVYIGEAENVYSRLIDHVAKKDFWHEAIVFISKDTNLNKAHIKFLENKLYMMATDADRYTIANRNVPTLSTISESDESEMEEFLEHIKLLVNTLGHKVLEPKRARKAEVEREAETFQIIAARGANGSGEISSDGFVVFAGSKAAIDVVSSTSSWVNGIRTELIERKILRKENDHYLFTVDHIFKSPSSAAAVVMGRNANGLSEWKLKDGRSIKDFES